MAFGFTGSTNTRSSTSHTAHRGTNMARYCSMLPGGMLRQALLLKKSPLEKKELERCSPKFCDDPLIHFKKYLGRNGAIHLHFNPNFTFPLATSNNKTGMTCHLLPVYLKLIYFSTYT